MTRCPLSGERLIAAIGAQLDRIADYAIQYLSVDQVHAVADMLRGCAHRIDLLAIERGPWVEFDMDEGGAA